MRNVGDPTASSIRKTLWWPRDRRQQVAAAILLPITLAWIIEYAFQPFRSLQFLRFATDQDLYRPYAYVAGSVLAIGLTWAIWASRKVEPNKRLHEGTFGRIQFVGSLLFSPALGFVVGWFAVTFCVPFVQHLLAVKTPVEHAFTVTGFAFGKACKGVLAVNPLFFDNKLCGVGRSGHSSEWEGRTIVVTGRQSRFGMTMDRYRVEERSPSRRPPSPARPSTLSAERLREIGKAFRRCIPSPLDAPKPFDVMFRIVIEAEGGEPSVQVASSQSPSTLAHEATAQSIIAALKSCPSLRDVPYGTYALPVVVQK